MERRKRSRKQSIMWKLCLLAAAVFAGSLSAGAGEVKAADPLFEYKDEAVYRVGNSLRDKEGRYLLRQGLRMQFTATQTVYGSVTAIDWGFGTYDDGNIISIVGGKPDVGDRQATVVVQGTRPGVATLNGRVLSTSMYDTQWCDNKFPIRVVEPLREITLEKDKVNLTRGETAEAAVAVMVPDSLYSLLFSMPLSYTSTNPSVAGVDENGKITAVGNGTATIRVSTRDNVSAVCTVNVGAESTGGKTSTSSKSLSLNKTKMTLQPGRKAALRAKYNGKTVTPAFSGGKGIVSVSKKGVITAKKVGTATVKVTYKKQSKSCRITVVPAAMSLKAEAGRKKVTLSWKKVSGAAGYKVYRASSAKGRYTEIKTMKAKEKKLVLKGQKKGICYYKIRSLKKVGGRIYQGALSKPVRVKIR